MNNIVETCVDCHLLVPSVSLDPNFDRDNPSATQLIFFLLLPNSFVHRPCIYSSLTVIQDGFTFMPALVVSVLLLDLDVLSFILASPLARLIARNHGTSSTTAFAAFQLPSMALQDILPSTFACNHPIVSARVSELPYWLQEMDNIVENRIGSTLLPFISALDVNFDLENQSAIRCLTTLNSRLLQVYASFNSNLNTRLLRFDVPSDFILSALNSKCRELCPLLFVLKSSIASSDDINHLFYLKLFSKFNQGI